MKREELKSKLNTANNFCSYWWWLVGGFYGIIFLTARSGLKAGPASGYEEIRLRMQKAKNKARNSFILVGVFFSALAV